MLKIDLESMNIQFALIESSFVVYDERISECDRSISESDDHFLLLTLLHFRNFQLSVVENRTTVI